MECKACGYRAVWRENKYKVAEEFIKINGNFTVEKDLNYGTGLVEIRLYCCPKCDTVIADRF